MISRWSIQGETVEATPLFDKAAYMVVIVTFTAIWLHVLSEFVK